MPPEKVAFYFKGGIEMTTKNKQNRLLKPVFAAILAALAIIVGYIEIAWPAAPHLKLDFSEVIILVSLLMVGFNYTLGVIVIRSVVRWLITGHSTNIPYPFFGETIAIVASIVMVLIYMLFTKTLKLNKEIADDGRIKSPYHIQNKNKSNFIKELAMIVIVTILMAIFMVGINFVLVTPAYLSAGKHPLFFQFLNSGQFDGGLVKYTVLIVSMYLPFNLVKFALCTSVFTIIKKPLKIAITIE